MINIFVSYSHKNSYWLDKNDEFNLIPFLEDSLKWQKVKFWYDHDLRTLPGVEYEKMINQEIEKSQLAVLLLSRDFINSSFIMEKELPKIKERLDANKINIIPILVEPWTMPVNHPASWLIKTQIIPGMPTPLINFTDTKRNFLYARNGILESLERIIGEIITPNKFNGIENKNETSYDTIEPKLKPKDKDTKLNKKQSRDYLTFAEGKNVPTNKVKLNKIKININTTLNIQASDVTVSSDGKILVTSIGYGMLISGIMGHSGKIEVWDLEKNSCLFNITDNIGILQSVKISPDDKLIAACAHDRGKELLIWNFHDGRVLPEFLRTNGHNIKCLEFTQDGKYLLCSVDRTIQIWDIKKRTIVSELEGHKNKVQHIAIDKKSKMAISTSDSSEVGIWDLNLFQNTRFINIGTKVGKVVFLNDSNTVGFAFGNIGSNQSSEIAIFDLKNDLIVKILSGRKGDSIYSLAYNEHTKLLVSGSGQSNQNAGGTLAIYHTGNNHELIDVKEFEYGRISNIAFSKNGKVIASTHGEPEPIKGKVGRYSVKIWNVNEIN